LFGSIATSQTTAQWIGGTTAIAVAAGDKIKVDGVGVFEESAGSSLTLYAYLYPCYRTGTGATPVLGNSLRSRRADATNNDTIPFGVTDVFTFSAAGSYEFGLCARVELGGDPGFNVNFGRVNAIRFQ
jgi:hypothetical protein